MLSAGGEGIGEPHFDGDRLLVALLSIALGLGAAIGILFTRVWVVLRSLSARTTGRQLPPWERLVRRAIRFIQKRRAIGVAFHNLGTHSLRPSPGSRPTTLRQRRAATPVGPRTNRVGTIIHEGPAINHGPDR